MGRREIETILSLIAQASEIIEGLPANTDMQRFRKKKSLDSLDKAMKAGECIAGKGQP